MSTAFYNEIEPFAATWLRNLDAAGHIVSGVVDERSVRDLKPGDVSGFAQAHFFAGIGGWSHALRLAGWPDDEPVWTGSCPCQPFSQAGRRGGISDERHLWPEWFRLIRECRPPVVFGEQVASPDGLAWFDAVSADLEGEGYAVGATDLCAASSGAPHIRQRLYFVAHADECFGRQGREIFSRRDHRSDADEKSGSSGGGVDGLADDDDQGRQLIGETREHDHGTCGHDADGRGPPRGMGDSSSSRSGRDAGAISSAQAQGGRERIESRRVADESFASGATNGFWRGAEWVYCLDDKWRPVEPGSQPLAHGVPGRVGKLRGYGNAIVPQVAATFIEAAIGAIREND